MKIEIDTSQELSAIDKSILAVLCGNDVMTITETHAIGNMSHTVTKTTPQQTQIELHTHIAAADNPATGAIDSSDPINMGFGDAPQVINPEPTLADITVDKHGTPYDNRIHSTPCSTNKDGSFRRRKGIDDAEFERISNELRGVAAIPTPAPGAMLAPPPPPPPLAVLAPYIPASTPIAPPPPPPAAGPSPFAAMMLQLTPLMAASGQGGKLQQSDLVHFAKALGCVDAAGVGQVGLLMNAPQVIPTFLQACIAHNVTLGGNV